MGRIWKIIGGTLLFMILFYGALALIPSRPIRYMDDHTLRDYALSHGLAPIPDDTQAMLRITENPDNPLTPQKVALGQRLFFDPILSRDRSISCATCHILGEGGDDNLPTAIGYHGRANPKHLNSPTVLNAALAKRQFWDGRAADVEEQAGGPIQAPFEMDLTPAEAVTRLSHDPGYAADFGRLFDAGVTFSNIRKAIGAYERTLLTRGAYDRFLEGDDHAMSAAAKRGMNLFIQKGCKGCHTGMAVGGQSIQHFPLRRTIGDIFKTEPFPFPNKGGFLGRDGDKKFRVPILRNITRTAPYFHNGSVQDLREAVRIMSKYQIGEEFSPAQIEDVVAFLKSLEGEIVPYDLQKQTVAAGADCSGQNLSGRDFSHRNLHGIDLKGADLRGCNFFDTDLSGANLTGAKVDDADFTSADLSYANLSFVDLRHTDLIETRLEGTGLYHARWRDGKICAKGSVGKCL